ncbi:MAG: hypothetical protein AMJ65_12640 [Phycisphaerae bacterium SG8_4]|nr:MAG: hypothetical protein AMJ65_12640 [Phycisphaerae bacterium SG8_4]
MTNKKDQEWLDEKITQALDFGKVRFDAQEWKQKYVLNECHKSSFSYRPVGTHRGIWRTIMESKVTKYSAAAVIILALTLVLVGPFWAPGNGNVVLAEVRQRVNGIETIVIRGTKTFTRPGEPDSVFEIEGIRCEFDLVKYFSLQHGLVEEGYVGGELIYRFTFNRPKRQTLLLIPPHKKYGTFPSTDMQMRLLENGTPKGIVNLLMEGDHRKLGRDNINGIETEVFEFQDPVTFKELAPKAFLDIQDIKGNVWIGVEEQLPVRVEGDFVIGKCLMSMFHNVNLHEVNTLGEYNIELDEGIFSTDPPEGYAELTLTDILPLVPLEAKAGLAGLGMIPVGLIVWKRRRRKTTANPG